MTESTSGLVVRVRPLTETSLIVHWLTAEQGRISTVAKGARRPKSPFRGKVDVFYFADFSFARSARSELHQLREVNLRNANPALRRELAYLQQAAYCVALVELTTETETPLPGIFQLVMGLIDHLPRQMPQGETIYAFELKLLEQLGLQPDLQDKAVNPGVRELARTLMECNWNLVSRLRASETQLATLRGYLNGFLIYHLGRLPNGRDSALAV